MFEAMVSGALVFVDEMWGPQPFPLKHKEHVIVYNTKDQNTFTEQLKYYLDHPDEARRIAHQGYLHVLKYHRWVEMTCPMSTQEFLALSSPEPLFSSPPPKRITTLPNLERSREWTSFCAQRMSRN